MPLEDKTPSAQPKGFRIFFPTCRQAAMMQSETMDRSLPLSKRIGLVFHLAICKWCRRYGKQIRFLCEAVEEHPERLAEAASKGLSPEARERMIRQLRSNGK